MYELFFENLAKHIKLESFEREKIEEKLHLMTFSKKEKLLVAGEQSRFVYFVNKGCLRIFESHENGEDTNILFCPEQWWANDINSFSQGAPAAYSIEALEETEVVSIHNKDLEELYEQVPKLERFFRILYQNGFGLYQSRLTLALSTSAETRYLLFKKQYPTLGKRVSQKQIASYLGITTVFLSIIKKKTKTSKN